MSYKRGCYLMGLNFIKTLTGLCIDNITYAPFGVSAQEKTIAIKSVNNASTNPIVVIQLVHTEEQQMPSGRGDNPSPLPQW